MFDNNILLITGGTGSFGQTILKRFLDTGVREIRIFSRDEKKQEDLRLKLSSSKLKFFIGDVRDVDSLEHVMKGVDFVFHAAALKQVPSCEFYPMEAIKTNVLGTENVLKVATSAQVKKVILLSTDKAVYPISAMGISKAMAEKVLVASSRLQQEGDTVFCATRYGNVMASRGSVIPLFVRQIKENRALTLTNPNMTRFLMSLEDSVNLVLHAFKYGKQGDIFVQKAPACSVGTLATALKELFSSESEIRIIGTRHGEKLYESLISSEEMGRVEDMRKFYRLPADNRDLNYDKYFTEGESALSGLEAYTSHNTERFDVEKTKQLLMSLDFIRNEIHA